MKRPVLLGLLCLSVLPAFAQGEAPRTPGVLPVREITVFKDGHAFVLHEGELPAQAPGTVTLDPLPVPVLGTFWPYSADPQRKLVSVTASQRRTTRDRTALNIPQLLAANPGAPVRLVLTDKRIVEGEVVEVPERQAEDPIGPAPYPLGLGAAYLSGGGFGGLGGFGGGFVDPSGSVRSDSVLVKTGEGVQVLPLSLIQSVVFRKPHRRTLAVPEVRRQLQLQLEGVPANGKARVGMVYLQKGLRWIPDYRLDIDGQGSARVRLQATLLNELVDLRDVTMHLVIGVPTFFFKDTPDPISLQQAFPALSRFFQPDSQTGYAFSNALMSQGGFGGGMAGGLGGAPAPRAPSPFCAPPEVDGAQEEAPGGRVLGDVSGDRSEDLYLFTVRNVSLKKGESLVLPVAEYTLRYQDVFTVELPFQPPAEVLSASGSTSQDREIARLSRDPRAYHKIRLQNDSKQPLTTAPALVVNDGRVVAQSLMAYTPSGGSGDLTITVAPDVRVRKEDREVKRTPEAARYQGQALARLDLEGTVTLRNLRTTDAEVEVVRYLPGNVSSAGQGGKVERVGLFEAEDLFPPGALPSWWRSYSWPSWWHHYNGLSRITWRVRVPAGQTLELPYTWHYFAS